jgi:hypothetical protein
MGDTSMKIAAIKELVSATFIVLLLILTVVVFNKAAVYVTDVKEQQSKFNPDYNLDRSQMKVVR